MTGMLVCQEVSYFLELLSLENTISWEMFVLDLQMQAASPLRWALVVHSDLYHLESQQKEIHSDKLI